MRQTMLAVVIFLAFAMPCWAAPLFDLHGTPQARDAVAALAARGLLKGYPGGIFKGDRRMSRNEVAELLNRLDLYLESLENGTASKAELRTVGTSVSQLRKNLDNLNGQAEAEQAPITGLDQRTRLPLPR